MVDNNFKLIPLIILKFIPINYSFQIFLFSIFFVNLSNIKKTGKFKTASFRNLGIYEIGESPRTIPDGVTDEQSELFFTENGSIYK